MTKVSDLTPIVFGEDRDSLIRLLRAGKKINNRRIVGKDETEWKKIKRARQEALTSILDEVRLVSIKYNQPLLKWILTAAREGDDIIPKGKVIVSESTLLYRAISFAVRNMLAEREDVLIRGGISKSRQLKGVIHNPNPLFKKKEQGVVL